MPSIIQPVGSLLSSYGLLILANGLFATLLSLRSKAEGFSDLMVGVLMATFYFGFYLGARFAPRLVQRSGQVRSFAVLASLMSISPLLHLLWVNPVPWSILRLVDGFCLAGLTMITESWLNARASNENRGKVLACYMTVYFLAHGISQLLLSLAEINRFELFALSAVFFSLSVIPLLLARSDAPPLEPACKLDLAHLLQRAPVGFWGAAGAGSVLASFFALAPVFARALGLNQAQIGYLMAAGVFGGLLLQIPLGKLSDSIERRRVIAMVALGGAICSAGVVWLVSNGSPLSTLLPMIFLFGCLAFSLYSLSAAHANDWCDANRRVQTSAGLIVGFSIGAILGPLASSLIMGKMGPPGLFSYIGGCCLLLSGYSFWQSVRFGRARTRTVFVPHPAAMIVTDTLHQAVQQDAPLAAKESPER